MSVDDGLMSYEVAAQKLAEILKRPVDPAIFSKLEGKFASNVEPREIIPGEPRFTGYSGAFEDCIHDSTLILMIPVIIPNADPLDISRPESAKGSEAQFSVDMILYENKNPKPTPRMIVQRNLLGFFDMRENPRNYPRYYKMLGYNFTD